MSEFGIGDLSAGEEAQDGTRGSADRGAAKCRVGDGAKGGLAYREGDAVVEEGVEEPNTECRDVRGSKAKSVHPGREKVREEGDEDATVASIVLLCISSQAAGLGRPPRKLER